MRSGNDVRFVCAIAGLIGTMAAGPRWVAAQPPWGIEALSVSSGEVSLAWGAAGSNHVYAVMQRGSMGEGGWAYAPPVDQWPVAGTNWTGMLTSAPRFYRIGAAERGALISSEHVATVPTNAIDRILELADVPLTAKYGAHLYQIVYETFDHRGQVAVGAGALVVPEGPTDVPLLSYQHGTIFLSSNAPSVFGSGEVAIGLALASQGYATTQPDFPGLGLHSPPLHPYLHARSEAVASVDLLRAGRTFISNTNFSFQLNGQVFLLGYSQGGHATMALQRELEWHHTNEFTIAASAPMAGPYNMSGTVESFMAMPVAYGSPAYMPYLLFAYDGVYDLFADPGEVFTAPYDTLLPPMFDGRHTGGEINAIMPSVMRDALQPAFLTAFTNDANHPVRVALRANDLWDWTPVSPTRMYHCAGDDIVPFANSQVAYDQFILNGCTNVTLIDPFPAGDHGGCVTPAVLDALAWFDELRTTNGH